MQKTHTQNDVQSPLTITVGPSTSKDERTVNSNSQASGPRNLEKELTGYQPIQNKGPPSPSIISHKSNMERTSYYSHQLSDFINEENEFSGFKVAQNKPRFAPVFTAGVLKKGTSDDTLHLIDQYLRNRDVIVKSIRIVKDTGLYVSAKIIVNATEVQKITEDNGACFWPAGILCRLWRN